MEYGKACRISEPTLDYETIVFRKTGRRAQWTLTDWDIHYSANGNQCLVGVLLTTTTASVSSAPSMAFLLWNLCDDVVDYVAEITTEHKLLDRLTVLIDDGFFVSSRKLLQRFQLVPPARFSASLQLSVRDVGVVVWQSPGWFLLVNACF
jgi:hypothetical protein